MDNREAIQLLDELLLKGDFTDQTGDMDDSSPYEEAVEIARQAIEKQMSSIQPKRKTGRWEHDGGHFTNRWICSQCGYKFYFEKSEAKYCPNCGAKMESDKNDN